MLEGRSHELKAFGKEIEEVDHFHINFSRPYTKFCKDHRVTVKKLEPDEAE